MKSSTKSTKKHKLERRRHRVRARIFGNDVRPRLSVYRSLSHIYAQIINDETGKTLAAMSDLKLQSSKEGGKIGKAKEVGKMLAEAALKKQIKKVVFDRGSARYHGRIKALAEGAREGGLEF
ncbi:MAG: 50S ribosomal protein L18 [bacterium]